ncbi:hypothetical protein BKA70DRAFT_1128437 [Coprinopsis sp. MPI-PUGE-AT-0042]|nr:hypothetical protein BKA70DRAFT_1128437 [Coprinopsis sp. MPI-PUGE-AT-0042]
MSPRATSSSAASSSSSVRAASGSYSRRPVSQLKSTRQQFSACGACRMRRVRCDLKDLAIPTSGPHPTCSNCKERGIKCVDEFADVKAVKLLRRGRRLQQVEAIYGKSADPDNNGLSHSSRLANAIPTLHDGFFSSPFWRWFCIQRPILDAAEFYSRFEYHQKGERPLGPEGSIIAMLLVTWAYSYGLNEHGLPVHETDLSPSPSASLMSDEPTSDLGTSSKPLQGAQKTKEKFGQMLHQILDLVDYHGIMRRPSLDGVRALLLLLPLLEEAKPLERLVIHDTALSQIQVLCILAPSASPSSSSSISDDAATRARLFWYAFTQEGLSAGLRGGRFNLHRDDYESFQRTIPPPAYHGGLPYPPSSSSSVTPPSLPNSHPESQVYNHLLSSSAIPLQVNTVCRKIHTVLTGPRAVRRAEEHNLIDAHGMQEIWRDLDQCWRELSIIRRNAVNDEDSASRCDTERYACAWQIFIFECHNVVRESLKQFMSAAAQSQHPPSSRPTSHSSASPFLPPDHLHLTATRKCLELLPRVIRIMQFSLTSSGYPDRSGIFSWDSGLVRDGCFYAGYLAASTEEVVLEPTHDVQTSEQDERELSPSPLTADEGVMVCLAVLSSKRWLFSKSDEREETIRMIWEARKAKRHGQGVRYGDPPYDATYSHAGAHLSSRAHDGYQAPNQSMLGAPAPHLDRPNLPTLDVLAYQRRSESMANTANGYGSHGWSSHTPPPTPQSHGWPFT